MSKPTKRWLQFSMSTLLLGALLCSFGAVWWRDQMEIRRLRQELADQQKQLQQQRFEIDLQRARMAIDAAQDSWMRLDPDATAAAYGHAVNSLQRQIAEGMQAELDAIGGEESAGAAP